MLRLADVFASLRSFLCVPVFTAIAAVSSPETKRGSPLKDPEPRVNAMRPAASTVRRCSALSSSEALFSSRAEMLHEMKVSGSCTCHGSVSLFAGMSTKHEPGRPAPSTSKDSRNAEVVLEELLDITRYSSASRCANGLFGVVQVPVEVCLVSVMSVYLLISDDGRSCLLGLLGVSYSFMDLGLHTWRAIDLRRPSDSLAKDDSVRDQRHGVLKPTMR
jgi:hypothetical protein